MGEVVVVVMVMVRGGNGGGRKKAKTGQCLSRTEGCGMDQLPQLTSEQDVEVVAVVVVAAAATTTTTTTTTTATSTTATTIVRKELNRIFLRVVGMVVRTHDRVHCSLDSNRLSHPGTSHKT